MTLLLLILLLGASTMTGCSHQTAPFKFLQPSKYELTALGKLNNKSDSLRIYKINDKIIYASPRSIHPSGYSLYLLEHTQIHKGESVLDIGTATGVQTLFAADKASHVLAMDISPDAIKDTAHNARRLGIANKVSVRESDIFNALKPNEIFDVIISSIPFPTDATNQRAWKLQERFFQEAGKHLNPNGRIYFSTGVLDTLPRTKSLIDKYGLKIVRINMDYISKNGIEHIIYVIKHAENAKWPDQNLAPQN